MGEDFGKLPDEVTGDWLWGLYYDLFDKLNSFQAMDRIAVMINEVRAAYRQEITDLRAKLATFEEREKQSAVEFEQWRDDGIGLKSHFNAFWAGRIGWEPKRDLSKWLCVEWPEGSLDVQLQFYGKGDLEKLDHIIRPTAQLTPAQIRAEMLAKLDEEYQRIEAEMSRIEAMTDAEVLAEKEKGE